MKKKSRILLVILFLLLAVGVLAAFAFYQTFYQDNVAATEKPQDIRIYRDFTGVQMRDAVLQSGVIDNEKTFLRAAMVMRLEDHFRPFIASRKGWETRPSSAASKKAGSNRSD